MANLKVASSGPKIHGETASLHNKVSIVFNPTLVTWGVGTSLVSWSVSAPH